MSAFHEQYIKRILDARVYDVCVETRLHEAPLLSKRFDNQILLKREDEQPIFSFKCRGAFNRIYKLTQSKKLDGVVAASAGNHAQGVALAAKKLGLKAVIVMPETTPSIKVESVQALGAQAILHGDDFDTAFGHAMKVTEEYGYEFIHPFDAPDTIAGQGTIAVELCKQHPEPIHAVFVPVGGGGIASGIAAYLKHARPEIKVIGVEPVEAACMHDAIKAGERVVLDQVGLFADGVAVKQAGEETFRICREFLDDVILVSVDEMSAAIKDIFTDTRTLVEPAGALAVAGIKKYVQDNNVKQQTLVAINSGANISFDRLRHVAERAEIGESREALYAVTIPERPGSFRRFCEILGKRSITEFNYRYSDDDEAVVFAGVVTPDGEAGRKAITSALEASDYKVLDMTHNDTAKLHVRHMVGGSAKLDDERLFRFRFPERPGALLGFLDRMGEHWNISLFHYRNHGAAYGRVLVGMQLPQSDQQDFDAFIKELGFAAFDETDNEAYATFLR